MLTAIVIFEAVRRLISAHVHTVDASIAAFAVIIGSIVIDFLRSVRDKDGRRLQILP